MNQTRLNWCMVLHIHNDDTDRLKMIIIVDVANEFVSRNSTRSHIFGRFVQGFFYCLLLFQLASKCVLDTLKSQNFPGEHAPGPPFGSQISTPKTKILSTALLCTKQKHVS